MISPSPVAREKDRVPHRSCNTPYLLMDLDQVSRSFDTLRASFPDSAIHYAVKANPAPEIVRMLARRGCCFDAASPAEVALCLAAGARPENLSYGNTVKKSADIAYAYQRGVRLFAFDCEEELHKLAAHAPGAAVFCRLATESGASCWPLARKFGCSAAMAEHLLAQCPRLGLLPWGISFHVGSQQMDPSSWDEPLRLSASIFRRLHDRGIHLKMLNLGGGFPARYRTPAPQFSEYATRIRRSLHEHFAGLDPETMLEPGRSLVADAGTIVSRVVLVSRRDPDVRWVYLDIGKFGGLAETMDECIQYRIRTPHGRGATGPVILAGPTCDSADILYEKTEYRLPLDLREGDYVEILSAGAYTASYASVGFNGFQPLPASFV